MGHKDSLELLSELDNLRQKIKVSDRFFHYKHQDQFYTVLAVGFIESSEEPCVVYQAEYGDKFTWVRTEAEFFSKATLEDGTQTDRFVKVS